LTAVKLEAQIRERPVRTIRSGAQHLQGNALMCRGQRRPKAIQRLEYGSLAAGSESCLQDVSVAQNLAHGRRRDAATSRCGRSRRIQLDGSFMRGIRHKR
jgi:hypothetical protein